jgi:hypothetical protein
MPLWFARNCFLGNNPPSALPGLLKKTTRLGRQLSAYTQGATLCPAPPVQSPSVRAGWPPRLACIYVADAEATMSAVLALDAGIAADRVCRGRKPSTTR